MPKFPDAPQPEKTHGALEALFGPKDHKTVIHPLGTTRRHGKSVFTEAIREDVVKKQQEDMARITECYVDEWEDVKDIFIPSNLND